MKITRNFCHLCGAPYVKDTKQPYVCSDCGNKHFVNPSPTAGILLFTQGGKAVFGVRAFEPAKGKTDLIGGFVDLGESIENAIVREIHEEVGLKAGIDYEIPEFFCSTTSDYTFVKDPQQNIDILFTAKLYAGAEDKMRPSDDVAELIYADISDLDKYDFSVAEWKDITKRAHKKLFG